MLSVNNLLRSESSLFITKRKFASKSKNVRDAKYQYLQRSTVPTMHFQKSLPRLPVPELEKTGSRYLSALLPILNGDQYKKAELRTKKFIAEEGKILHEKLIKKDKANKHTSYISDYWFDLYLTDRVALPINYNPFIVFANDVKPQYNDQLIKSTNMLVSAVRFMMSLRERILEPEVFHMDPKKSDTSTFRTVTRLLPESLSWYGAYLFKAFPLDMSQFDGLFNGTRIPVIGKDRIFRDPKKSNHVVVQRNGHFYTFDVTDADGNVLSPSEIHANLSEIMKISSSKAEHPVGVLTTQNRDQWARQRTHLQEIGNEEVLRKIDTAIFNLVLDDEVLADNKHEILKHFLYGGTNRWFDKPISLIVTADGVAGINFEHSWGDGVAVLRFFKDIHADTTTTPSVHPDSKPATTGLSVKKLDFKLDDKAKSFVDKAKKDYEDWCNSLSIDYLLYQRLTKEVCKQAKVSPDFVMQLSFQAAYHLMTGSYVGHYESCSTSAFKYGRTETMRPCTIKTKEFCDSLHSNSKSKSELRALMADSSKNHSELVKQASLGQGFDRHLFALKKIAEESNMPVPEIFDSYEYKFLNQSVLSTSTLSSPAVMAGGFGPTIQHGFGIGYSAFADQLGASVASYKTHNNSTQFVEALHKSFEDIREVLVNNK